MDKTNRLMASGTQAAFGRPPKNPDKPKYYESDLHAFLVEKLPEACKLDGRIDVNRLSDATGNHRYTVYRWLEKNRLSVKAVKSLIEISGDPDTGEPRLTEDMLTPFLFD